MKKTAMKITLPLAITAAIAASCIFLTCSHLPSTPVENQAPFFYHLPVFSIGGDTIVVAHTYRDTLRAMDPDSDAVTFSCSGCPAGLAFAGGKLSWTPTEAETGSAAFQIFIKDSKGASDSISLRYMVKDTNRAPSFRHDTSLLAARVGQLFTDTIRIVDPDRDIVTLILESAPDSMQVNNFILQWTPQEVDTGETSFFIHANDSNGGYDTLMLVISVSDTNHRPVFITRDSSLDDTIIVGDTYQDTLVFRDPEGDSLAVMLFGHPTRMTFRDSVVEWSPTVADTGLYAVYLQVCDSSGLCTRIDWSIMVLDSNHAPAILSDSLDMPDSAFVGRPIRDTIHASDPDMDTLVFAPCDSSSRIIMNDSILAWTPAITDTPGKTICVYVSDNQGKYDSLSWYVAVSDTNHWPQFLITASMLDDTLALGDTFIKLCTALDYEGDSVEIHFIDSVAGMVRSGDTLQWVPTIADTGWNRLSLVATDTYGGSDTVTWHILVNAWPNVCPSYTHKYDAKYGNPAALDEGYFIYSVDGKNGMYKSHFSPFKPVMVPGTNGDLPSSMAISDDGQWIIYVDQRMYRPWIMRHDGKYRTEMPLVTIGYGYPRVVGFLRNSPYGNEIYYFSDNLHMEAIRVYYESDTVLFGASRTLVDCTQSDTIWSMVVDPLVGICAVGNEVFGRFQQWTNGTLCTRTEFLTIPDNGKGLGTPRNIYRWKDDDFQRVDGCGHTLSHDGKLALVNPPFLVGSPTCVPHSHIGVAITPFRFVTDPPINLYTDHFDKNAISLNFCPQEYWPVSDFWGWYFTNNSDYVIGRLLMSNSPGNGVWMLEWKTNTWTRLTPSDSIIQSAQTAAWFGHIAFDSTDTVHAIPIDTPAADPFDPKYRVVSPNGGEVFHVNKQCTVSVTCEKPGDALAFLVLDAGHYEFPLPGWNASKDPLTDSLFVFTIPDSFAYIFYNQVKHALDTTRVSSVSDSCMIHIRHYDPNARYEDFSDAYFRIIP